MAATTYTVIRYTDSDAPGSVNGVLPEREVPADWDPDWGAQALVAGRLSDYLSTGNDDSTLDRAFIRTQDIQTFIDIAEKGYYIGVRLTGKLSLDRLHDGCACKPHDILDKSLKNSSVEKNYLLWRQIEAHLRQNNFERFTATPRTRNEDVRLMFSASESWDINPGQLTEISRTVALRVERGRVPSGVVTNICTFIEGFFNQVGARPNTQNNGVSVTINPLLAGLVGSWFSITLKSTGNDLRDADGKQVDTLTVDVPRAVLRVGPKRLIGSEEIAKRYGVEVPFDQISNYGVRPPDGYTGDYDLHEIYVRKDRENLAVEITGKPDTERPSTPIAREAGKAADWGNVVQDGLSEFQTLFFRLTGKLMRARKQVLAREGQRWTGPTLEKPDRYAFLIQHGPQNFYERYLAAKNRDLVAQGKNRYAAIRKLNLPELALPSNFEDLTINEKEQYFHYLNAFIWREELYEELVASLTLPDKAGVALFGPGRRIYILMGRASVRKAYQDIRVQVTRDNQQWVGGLLELEGSVFQVRKNWPVKIVVKEQHRGDNPAIKVVRISRWLEKRSTLAPRTEGGADVYDWENGKVTFIIDNRTGATPKSVSANIKVFVREKVHYNMEVDTSVGAGRSEHVERTFKLVRV